MKIGFLTFDQYQNKKNTAGSRIRCDYLIKHLPKSERYIQGKKYDALVLQKAYWGDMIKNFKGPKILDICDPDYLTQQGASDYFDEVNAITVSTESLKNDIEQYTDIPVYLIKDRFDLSELPKQKKHKGKAKKVVWFGNSENMQPLESTVLALKRLRLKLIVISNGSLTNGKVEVENIQWTPDYYNDIQKGDIFINPKLNYGKWKYKSENKTVLSRLLGVPVARNVEDLERLMTAEERKKEIEKYKWYFKEYNAKKSAKELLKIINEH